jgi:Curli production assembly/transport component CsgG
MQKLIPILLCILAFFSKVNAQDALDKEITLIINDLVAKMNTKAGIKNVAITDFTKLDGTPTELGKYLAEQFSDAMVNSKATFSIIDRARLNFLLKEAGLDAKGLLDPNSAAKLGKMKGIDAIVIGSMTSEGEIMRINVKALNLESAVILASSKGSIRRTPAIIALEDKGLGESTPSSSGKTPTETKTVVTKPSVTTPVSTPVQATFEKDALLFECVECKQSGTSVTCKLKITSRDKDDKLWINADNSSKFIDEESNDYFLSSVRLGNVSGQGQKQKDLVADGPMTAEFTFSGVTRQVASVSKIDINSGSTNNSWFHIVLKNIPVKH